MTDSALQSLYPVNQIGADGFNWWIGQVEKDSREDPKVSGRCKAVSYTHLTLPTKA